MDDDRFAAPKDPHPRAEEFFQAAVNATQLQPGYPLLEKDVTSTFVNNFLHKASTLDLAEFCDAETVRMDVSSGINMHQRGRIEALRKFSPSACAAVFADAFNRAYTFDDTSRLKTRLSRAFAQYLRAGIENVYSMQEVSWARKGTNREHFIHRFTTHARAVGAMLSRFHQTLPQEGKISISAPDLWSAEDWQWDDEVPDIDDLSVSSEEFDFSSLFNETIMEIAYEDCEMYEE